MGRWLACLVLCGSCGSSAVTELVVVVETNLAVPAELDRVDIVVMGPTSRMIETESLVAPNAPSFPLTLGVRPSAEALDVEVTAIGFVGDMEVVRTAGQVMLVEGERRVLHLVLLRGCAGRTCGEGETCGPGGCQPVQLADVPSWEGMPPAYVEMDPCDSLEWDVDGDGSGSLACGGDDCADDDDTIGPDVIESCDGVDNDCDGIDDLDTCACTEDGATRPCTNFCGSIGVETCMSGSYGACELLPETCNGMDDNCDGATDEGFDYVPLGEVRVTNDDDFSDAPRIVWADDRWGIVWRDELPVSPTDDDNGIFFSALDVDGATIVAPTFVGTDGGRPDVAWSGSVFGLVWIRGETVDTSRQDRLRARIFDATGVPLADHIRLDSDVDQFPRARIQWNGAAFVVAYRDGDIEVREFDESLMTIGGERNVPTNNGNVSDFSWSGTHYALAWARSDSAYFMSDTTPAFLTPQITVATSRRTQTASLDAIVGGNGGHLVGWYFEDRSGGPTNDQIGIEYSLVDAMGVPSGVVTNLSQTVGGRGFDEDYPGPPTVRSAPGQTLVTWADQRDANLEIYFARIATTGEIIQGATRLTNGMDDSDFSSADWDGERFGVVWRDRRDGNSEIYFNRLGCGP